MDFKPEEKSKKQCNLAIQGSLDRMRSCQKIRDDLVKELEEKKDDDVTS